MINLGDFVKGATVRVPFNSTSGTGASITLATNGAVRVYRDGSTAEITAGVTFSEDFDAATGMHYALIDTSNAAYTMPAEYDVSVVGAVVDGQTVNAWIGRFSLGRAEPETPVIGLAQAGAAGSVTLPLAASAANDFYNGSVVTIASGTGAGQSRFIPTYVGATRVATVDPNWVTPPDTTSVLVVTAVAPAPITALPDVNTKTFTPAAVTSVRDAILNWEPYTGYSLARLLRVLGIVMRGTLSGGRTGTEVMTAPAGGATVTATTDTNGNRTAVSDTASGTP